MERRSTISVDLTEDELESLADLITDKMEVIGDADSPHADPDWRAELAALRGKLMEAIQRLVLEG